MLGPRRVAAHVAVMEAKEIESLASFPQMHDPRLGVLQFQAELSQDHRKRRQGVLGFLFGLTHHQQIVGIANQHPGATPLPLAVKPVQEDVA